MKAINMPEGWKIAFDCDTSTDGGKERVEYALNLMKEMAEVLEQDLAIEKEAQGMQDYTDNIKLALNENKLQKQIILKKFREWK